ncbi:MAG: rod shape-determining protein MreD [Lachnospiraceae bacterium]|nr:rod shape-determining protein MreD [Lachnospiraceae bacterium]
MRRKFTVFLIITICFILQCTLFQALSFASISPNLLIVATSAFGFMRGRKEGMWIGFFSGLLLDLFFGSVIGFYALVYAYIGYVNGFFRKRFFPDDIKLPLILISASDLSYNMLVYLFLFFLRGRFRFGYYFLHIMLPELVYTILITIVLYFIILRINQKLEYIEKRSASKFV